MRTRSGRLSAAVVAAVAVAAVGQARAGTTYEASLVDPPGFYNGSGNPNGGFTIDTEGNVEAALRAKVRFSPAVINSPNNTYTVQTGTSAGGRATWNYEFSVNLRAGGGSLTLNDVTIQLGVDTDPTSGVSLNTIDPVTYWSDNAFFGGSGEVDATFGNQPDLTTVWGVQNSENLEFGDSPGLHPFDPLAPGEYEFDLTVLDKRTGGQLAKTTINVDVVPEPATLAIFGVGLAGLGVLRRRRKAG